MSVIRCSNGHFYDDVKFGSCPHCGIFAANDAADAEAVSKPKRSFFFGRKQREENDAKTVAKPMHAASPSNSSDVTVALSSKDAKATDADEQRTIGAFAGAKGKAFVTGWLVCISGPEKGRDYRLSYGFNRIGRSFDMEIALMADESVNREGHCSVVYDPVSNHFSLVPGKGNDLLYNGEPVFQPLQLQTGDCLGIGRYTYEFIAFCREGRVWEESTDKEEKKN